MVVFYLFHSKKSEYKQYDDMMSSQKTNSHANSQGWQSFYYFFIVTVLLVQFAEIGSVETKKGFPQIEEAVINNQVFTAPLTSGLYQFDEDGYIRMHLTSC